ncbi:MAG: LacI family DNA-binding transcriptional regulator [Clostridia bacterium]|nr:LacI family DNA-binding transcriptional regulator [Clostridia bacterium]
MKELAKLANTSVSTVSKAFRDADDVSQETKEHIFDIAKQHGCYGKFYQGKYHKKVIALVCPEIAGNYYSIFVQILQKLIEDAGGICLISTTEFNNQKQAELIEYYASYLQVDGLIVFGLKETLKKGYDIPIVSLFASKDCNVDSVNVDMESAMWEAVELLLQYGHRQIAFISEKLTLGKMELFQKIMAENKLDADLTAESDQRFEQAGIDGINTLLQLKKPFTAVICAYDHIAFGAIKQLKRNGFRVPQDCSVIGMDNISMDNFSDPSLTSIDTKPQEVCSIAWDLLQKKMENKYFKAKQSILIRSGLILRESVQKR